jgi:hypothetical protein
MIERGDVAERVRKDLVDVLFAVTSFHVFAELAHGERSREAVSALIGQMAADAVRRGSENSI